MTTENPRAVVGANLPPLDAVGPLEKRLERDHAALFAEAANLEMERFTLPEAPATDEEVAKITDFVVKVKKVAKRIEDARTEEGKPYLEASKAINGLFKEFSDPCKVMVDALTATVGIYNRAKAERERAERLERERQEREEGDRQRREEADRRAEAERLQRETDEAAARVRAAADAQSRAAAEAEMRAAALAGAQARKAADTAATAAAGSERRADQNARAADGDVGKLSRVSAGGSTSSTTLKWVGEITDMAVVLKSLGPLGPYLNPDIVTAAVARAVREHAAANTIGALKLPGVSIAQDARVNISAAR